MLLFVWLVVQPWPFSVNRTNITTILSDAREMECMYFFKVLKEGAALMVEG